MAVVFIGLILLCGAVEADAKTKKISQKVFASPEEAVKSLIDTLRTNNRRGLLAIFGREGKELIWSGDSAADKAGRERFVRAYDEKNSIEAESVEKMILHVGTNQWPLPIPIVKKGSGWIFDTKAGKDEILHRRIGRNEITVMNTLLAYLEAQREYAAADRDGDGILEYAQKIVSEKGSKDGLYWDVYEGGEESPLGPSAAHAAAEKCTKTGEIKMVPFHGYYYKILTGQGKSAKGGEYSYIVNDNMILGFAIIAWPAKYKNSGVTSFMINQEGVVYQKDLGKDTATIAESMTVFDPDSTWTKVGEKGL